MPGASTAGMGILVSVSIAMGSGAAKPSHNAPYHFTSYGAGVGVVLPGATGVSSRRGVFSVWALVWVPVWEVASPVVRVSCLGVLVVVVMGGSHGASLVRGGEDVVRRFAPQPSWECRTPTMIRASPTGRAAWLTGGILRQRI